MLPVRKPNPPSPEKGWSETKLAKCASGLRVTPVALVREFHSGGVESRRFSGTRGFGHQALHILLVEAQPADREGLSGLGID